jgi:cell division protease FtsH
MAQKMVARWGMSDALGPRVYGDNQSEVFLGRDFMTHKNISDATAQKVDTEITRIVEEQYARARGIIEDNREKVETMARALMEWETLDAKQIDDIMAGRPPRPPTDLPSSGARSGSAKSTEGTPKPAVKPNLDKPAGQH